MQVKCGKQEEVEILTPNFKSERKYCTQDEVKWVVKQIEQSGWPLYSRERLAVYEWCVNALGNRDNPPTGVTVARLRRYVTAANRDNNTKPSTGDKPGPKARSTADSTVTVAEAVPKYVEKYGIQPTVACIAEGIET